MRRWIATGLLAGSLIATGCAGGYVGYEARIPPPPLRVETYGPAPGPGYIWITGYWGYSGGNYVWQEGVGSNRLAGGASGKTAVGNATVTAIAGVKDAGASNVPMSKCWWHA